MKEYDNQKVNEALELLALELTCEGLTPSDFVDLAIACLDQAGISASTQSKVSVLATKELNRGRG